LEKVGQDKTLAFKLNNAISPDLQYYRLSLTPSLLEKIHPNIKAGFNEFALYEINKTHNKNHMGKDEPSLKSLANSRGLLWFLPLLGKFARTKWSCLFPSTKNFRFHRQGAGN
jgi:phenylalanyl-tRNA synthetase beta subunit